MLGSESQLPPAPANQLTPGASNYPRQEAAGRAGWAEKALEPRPAAAPLPALCSARSARLPVTSDVRLDFWVLDGLVLPNHSVAYNFADSFKKSTKLVPPGSVWKSANRLLL